MRPTSDFDSRFPEGFLRHERNEARTREYLIKRLALDPDVEDVDSAAREAFLRLPADERDVFHRDWFAFLRTME